MAAAAAADPSSKPPSSHPWSLQYSHMISPYSTTSTKISSADRSNPHSPLEERQRGEERDSAFEEFRSQLKAGPITVPSVSSPVVEPSPPEMEAARPWNLRSRRRPGNPSSTGERRGKERAKFSVTLTEEEIEEDIYSVTGARPRRRPRRRPRVVQRQLDSLFPGLWLSEISADLYKVPDE